MKHIEYSYNGGQCYKYNVTEYNTMKELSNDQQNDIIYKIKTKINKFKKK
jgi:hypothetical protein